MEPIDLAPADLDLLPRVDLGYSPAQVRIDAAREVAEGCEDPTWNAEGPAMLDDPDLLPASIALAAAA